VTNGILVALFAYATFSFGDAAVKALSGQLSIFEIGVFSTFFAGIALFFMKPKHERWRDFWRMKRPWAVHARAFSGVFAGIFGVTAFTTIPFAEAYALIFLAPFFTTLMSILFLKEKVGIWRWSAIVAGFCGVMLVVRPGFRELELGHLAAVIVAVLAATTVILLRSLAGQEKQTSILGVMIGYGLLFNVVAAAATSFAVPTLPQFGWLALAGLLAAGGQYFLMMATRLAPANQVAPTQYSQIVWAVLIGTVFFAEYPDWIAILGLAVVAASGLLTVLRERVRATKAVPGEKDRL